MKILIITTYFPPKRGIASLRPYSFAKYWSAFGHDVTVLTTKKYASEIGLELDCSSFTVIETPLPFWHKFFVEKKHNSELATKFLAPKGDFKPKKKWRIVELISNYREATGILKDQRMPSHLDPWYFSAVRAVDGQEWDLVVSTYSPYVAHLVAYTLVKRKLTKHWIADYRDLWTGSHLFTGVWPMSKLELIIEKKINKKADCVTTVSDSLGVYLKRNFNCKRVEIVENGFDPDDLLVANKEPVLNMSRVTISYTGTVYPNLQDVRPLFSAIESIKKIDSNNLLGNFEFLVAGKSGSYFKEIAGEYGISEYVRSVGVVSREDALRIQRDSQALIFLGASKSSVRGILTGKLFEYLSSGTQIWALGESEDGDAGKLIVQAKCGIVFGEDVNAVRDSLIRLLSENRKPKIFPDYKFVEQFSRKMLAKKMIDLLPL